MFDVLCLEKTYDCLFCTSAVGFLCSWKTTIDGKGHHRKIPTGRNKRGIV